MDFSYEEKPRGGMRNMAAYMRFVSLALPTASALLFVSQLAVGTYRKLTGSRICCDPCRQTELVCNGANIARGMDNIAADPGQRDAALLEYSRSIYC